eukprot:1792051-Rhodomonas_salina.2
MNVVVPHRRVSLFDGRFKQGEVSTDQVFCVEESLFGSVPPPSEHHKAGAISSETMSSVEHAVLTNTRLYLTEGKATDFRVVDYVMLEDLEQVQAVSCLAPAGSGVEIKHVIEIETRLPGHERGKSYTLRTDSERESQIWAQQIMEYTMSLRPSKSRTKQSMISLQVVHGISPYAFAMLYPVLTWGML